MNIGSTQIIDTFAEAFGMRYTRLIVTAHDEHWLGAALAAMTGYATSIISCDAEAGVEQRLAADQTPDGRVGAAVLIVGMNADKLSAAVTNRTGQCLMTCPTTAVYDGLTSGSMRLPLGKHVRFFGDGFQISKKLDGRRYWRVPVMDGEFLVEEKVGMERGVAGGNFILQGASLEPALAAARRAVEAIAATPGVITPFPGGVARSGSKIGSRYKSLPASTADAYCPTLRGLVESKLVEGANVALEIVIDGVDESSVARAMSAGIRAAAGDEILAIGAGNYGGKLGKYQFKLRELVGAG